MKETNQTIDVKWVSNIEFDKAYDEMLETFEAQTGFTANFDGIEFHFSNIERDWRSPKTMKVNWAAIGTQSSEVTAKFGKALMVAAKLAEDFIYNGYKIRYGD